MSSSARLFLTFTLLAFLIFSGTLGYWLIEDNWTWLDSLTMTVHTISTLGLKEVHPLSTTGLMFTNLLVVLGVIAMMYSLGVVGEVFLQGHLESLLGRRKDRRMLRRLKNHTIICGGGRTGLVVSQELESRGEPYVVLDLSPDRVVELQERKIPSHQGDATRDEILQEVGIERARGLVACMGTDAQNVFLALSARQLNPRLTIVAKAEDDHSSAKLRRAGADIVINPFETGGTRLALSLLKPTAITFMENVMRGHVSDEIVIDEIHLEEGSPWVGRTIRDLPPREESQINILAIQEANGKINFFPRSDAVLEQGSILVVMGERRCLADLIS